MADKAAHAIISVGGLAVIAAVMAIFVFILITLMPLFQGSDLSFKRTLAAPAAKAELAAAVLDEHQEVLVSIHNDGSTLFRDLLNGKDQAGPTAALAGVTAITAAQGAFIDLIALGLPNGRAWVGRAGVETAFEGDTRVKRPYVKEGGLLRLDPQGRPLSRLAVAGRGSRVALAAQTSPHSGLYAQADWDGTAWSLVVARPFRLEPAQGELSALVVTAETDRVLAGTSNGRLLEFRLEDDAMILAHDAEALENNEPVSALAQVIGERGILIGGQRGGLASQNLLETDDGERYARLHAFKPMGATVLSFAVSNRDRSFVALDEDDLLRGYFLTSERILYEQTLPAGHQVRVLAKAPRADGLIALDAQGAGPLYGIHNPHPEITWRTLFGPVHYEGYEEPDYVWQSSGATDSFESKLSLTPLIYGTFKGTFYAMLFAVPLAILAAIYVSQFMSRSLKALVKPVIEIMAALPSVVLGFLAALLLAPLIEKHLFTVLLGTLGLPIFALASLLVWRAVPRRYTRRLPEEAEIAVLMVGLAVGVFLVGQIGPGLEVALFNDFKVWMNNQLGVHYDQRNSLVVGFAMGFAVIPIIFTIAEDSLSSVPKHLTSASLSSGATPWQTAILVVLPVALSGIFSATMVGFGRAVGETMIVLMATGNTPVMDFSAFTGFRALSANIAVEIPEAPVGGTLYRVLFLAGMLLFLTTFVVNTVAELIRLHLRRKYSQL